MYQSFYRGGRVVSKDYVCMLNQAQRRKVLLSLIPSIEVVERTINAVVEDDVEDAISNLKSLEVVKLDLETLVNDMVISILDELNLSDYIESIDVDEGKVLLEVNSSRIRKEAEQQHQDWEDESKAIVMEWFRSRG